MNSAIITIGNELLRGTICDTNSQWLSNYLYKLGFPVSEIASLPDDEAVITRKLRQFSNEYPLVFVTGGLGPTSDDLTRDAAAEAFCCPLESRSELIDNIRLFFSRLNKDMPASNRRQALIPKGATVLNNSIGTAPGFVVSRGEKQVFFFPGVPSELKKMFSLSVEPMLVSSGADKVNGRTTLSRTYNVCSIGESTLEDKIGHLANVTSNPSLTYLCSPGIVSITIKSVASNSLEARDLLDSLETRIRSEIGDLIRGRADEELVDGVLRLLKEKNKYIYIRDVETGGLLGATICNAITCNDEDFSLSLFAGSLVLGGMAADDSGSCSLFDKLVIDSKEQLKKSKGRVEIVIARSQNEISSDNSSVISKVFIGAGSEHFEFSIETFHHQHNNAVKLVNSSLAFLYKTLERL
jgi:nicotinamide-nucleotide amidase